MLDVRSKISKHQVTEELQARAPPAHRIAVE